MPKHKGKQCFDEKLDQGLRKMSDMVTNALGGIKVEISRNNPKQEPPPSPDAASIDSNDAFERHRGPQAASGKREVIFDGGDLVLLALGILLLPVWIVIGFFYALGPLGYALTRLVTALSASFYAMTAAMGGNLKESKRTKSLWAEVGREWAMVGRRMFIAMAAFSKPFGLSKVFTQAGRTYSDMKGRYDNYVTAPADAVHTPESFRERYHVVDQLPSGGSSARVYVVRPVGASPEDLRVLKYFDLTSGAHLESLVREENAVKLARRLNLISDSNLDERSFWYVMPYYRGATMTRAVLHHKDGSKPIEGYDARSLGWVHQLLQVLSQYHDAGILHKDIKPDNLIVNGEHLYLVDIGLLTDLTSDQQLTTHGTEYFRDPEMVKFALKGQKVRDVSATKFDLYSIGAVLFFLFEGEFPTNGSLSRMGKAAPRAVRMIASKAMGPFDKRYRDARQMLADIDYLCWAASQGELEKVRVTDLPSFRNQEVEEPDLPASHQVQPAQSAAYYPPSYTESFAAHRRKNKQGSPLSEVIAWIIFALCGTAIAIVALVTEREHDDSPATFATPNIHHQNAAFRTALANTLAERYQTRGNYLASEEMVSFEGISVQALQKIEEDAQGLVSSIKREGFWDKNKRVELVIRAKDAEDASSMKIADAIAAALGSRAADWGAKVVGPNEAHIGDSLHATSLPIDIFDERQANTTLLNRFDDIESARTGAATLPVSYVVCPSGVVRVFFPGARLAYEFKLAD